MFFPAIFCICFMFSQQLTLLVFLLSNQSSLFCSVLPYWSQGSIFDYYSSLEGDHLVINSMTSIIWRKGTQGVSGSGRQFQFRRLSPGNSNLRNVRVCGGSENLRTRSNPLCEGLCLWTCLFPVVSAFPVTSSTEQVGFLPNNDKGFCVIMFLSFILSFVFSLILIPLQKGMIIPWLWAWTLEAFCAAWFQALSLTGCGPMLVT